MGTPYTRAPHQGSAGPLASESPHAALLIDFDNVTMGMRSDLSKELKSLLGSDVIKGKVSVQRAYADWRRYPQYIVPLSEASVDLIFAPAYGSNKKNATDIRMAIDALELVFIRPEIGTYILLTGDSDFSSLVLKLKEYGKYVIGVGIEESTSDILVQNCDEYYSYTSLTGLRKTTDGDTGGQDPWVLVEMALKKMVDRSDVMRSDRLKQVMQEIDSSFDEGSFGFSKFSRFLAEASSRGLVQLRRMDNGQYEVSPGKGTRGKRDDGGSGRSKRDDDNGSRRGGRGRGRRDRDRGTGRDRSETEDSASAAASDTTEGDDDLDSGDDGYGLLTRALATLKEGGRSPVRDSDVKRKMLEMDRGFDETELGFPKFSKFLGQAERDGVVTLDRTETGNYQVTLVEEREGGRSDGPTETAAQAPKRPDREARPDSSPSDHGAPVATSPGASVAEAEAEPARVDEEIRPEPNADAGLRLGPRRGSTRRRGGDDPPPLFAGQAVSADSLPAREGGGRSRAATGNASDQGTASAKTAAPVATGATPASTTTEPAPSLSGGADSVGNFDAGELGLPTDADAIVRYMAHRYRGVGEKTAETLVEKFGTDVFQTFLEDRGSVAQTVTPKRAEQVLEAWDADYERRTARRSGAR